MNSNFNQFFMGKSFDDNDTAFKFKSKKPLGAMAVDNDVEIEVESDEEDKEEPKSNLRFYSEKMERNKDAARSYVPITAPMDLASNESSTTTLLDVEKSLDSIIQERGSQFKWKPKNNNTNNNKNSNHRRFNNQVKEVKVVHRMNHNTITNNRSNVKDRLGTRLSGLSPTELQQYIPSNRNMHPNVPNAGNRNEPPMKEFLPIIGTLFDTLDNPGKATFCHLLKNIGSASETAPAAHHPVYSNPERPDLRPDLLSSDLFPGVSKLPDGVQAIFKRQF